MLVLVNYYLDRMSVVYGKRVDLVGCRIIQFILLRAADGFLMFAVVDDHLCVLTMLFDPAVPLLLYIIFQFLLLRPSRLKNTFHPNSLFLWIKLLYSSPPFPSISHARSSKLLFRSYERRVW